MPLVARACEQPQRCTKPPTDMVEHFVKIRMHLGDTKARVATDGGSDLPPEGEGDAKVADETLRQGVWAVAVDAYPDATDTALHTSRVWGGRTTGVDQTAYASEWHGLLVAAAATAEAQVDAKFILDNASVVDVARQASTADYTFPVVGYGLAQDWRCASADRRHELGWVPSHGKNECWRPPEGEAAVKWRELNKLADEQCTRCLRGVMAHVDIQSAGRQRGRAKVWANTALSHLRFATNEYEKLIMDRESRANVGRQQSRARQPPSNARPAG